MKQLTLRPTCFCDLCYALHQSYSCPVQSFNPSFLKRFRVHYSHHELYSSSLSWFKRDNDNRDYHWKQSWSKEKTIEVHTRSSACGIYWNSPGRSIPFPFLVLLSNWHSKFSLKIWQKCPRALYSLYHCLSAPRRLSRRRVISAACTGAIYNFQWSHLFGM